jgi:hypothetical protein
MSSEKPAAKVLDAGPIPGSSFRTKQTPKPMDLGFILFPIALPLSWASRSPGTPIAGGIISSAAYWARQRLLRH